jgi:hypothetical protein
MARVKIHLSSLRGTIDLIPPAGQPLRNAVVEDVSDERQAVG